MSKKMTPLMFKTRMVNGKYCQKFNYAPHGGALSEFEGIYTAHCARDWCNHVENGEDLPELLKRIIKHQKIKDEAIHPTRRKHD